MGTQEVQFNRDITYYTVKKYGKYMNELYTPKAIYYIGCHPKYHNLHYFSEGVLDVKANKKNQLPVFETEEEVLSYIKKSLENKLKKIR